MKESELQTLIKKYRVPLNIRNHMRQVSYVGLFLAYKMRTKMPKLNLKVVRQAALLHDLVKLVDFKTVDTRLLQQNFTKTDLIFWQKLIKKYHALGHAEAGFQILAALGHFKIAKIVKKHGFNALIAESAQLRPTTWEEKIVYYADKRVKHDQIVSLKERLKDGQQRYFPTGNVPASDKKVQAALLCLEKDLCRMAGIKPGHINQRTIANFIKVLPASY